VALAKQHLKISRQRKDRAIKDALALSRAHELVVFEELHISNMVRNHKLAKSMSDASWYQFTQWLQYFAKIRGTIVIAVPPHYTTIDCSNCGAHVEKTLSTRTHRCICCSTVLDRDENAARNVLAKGLKLLAEYVNGTQGYFVTGAKNSNAQRESNRWLVNGDVDVLSRFVELRTNSNWEELKRR
jgi:putative transposase